MALEFAESAAGEEDERVAFFWWGALGLEGFGIGIAVG